MIIWGINMKKFLFGVLVFFSGFIFLVFSFMYAIKNPVNCKNIDGLMGSLKGNDLLGPFIISLIVTLIGLGLCGYEAYGREEVSHGINNMFSRMNEMNQSIKDKLYK